MLFETLGFFAGFIMLTLIGLGPAVLALRRTERRLAYAGAVAPAVGLALMTLLGLPLVRYVGPVRVWVWPMTGLLVVISLALAARDWQQRRAEWTAMATWRSTPRIARRSMGGRTRRRRSTASRRIMMTSTSIASA